MKNKVIADIVQTNIKSRIKSATGCIAESTDWNPPGEKRKIKKVNNLQDGLSQSLSL